MNLLLRIAFFLVLSLNFEVNGQLNPAITAWMQNNTELGSYYMNGNPTPISNSILVNCQSVQYSPNWAYITATGIPGYVTGPFLDGNPSQAQNQNAIFKVPLNPTQNTGTPTSTTMGNIGVFINGVALFDYRDGVSWNTSANALCGGPGNPPCPGGPAANMPWNRDAVVAEREGFDCSKGHPAMGNYHHHQNPSAFKLDLNVLSTICDIYDADGLYAIDSTMHSPLLGFAYDGFPIYGAYGFKNADGTGGITRIKSGYQLRNITDRTVWADGTDVDDGPAINATYPLGYFREDYEFISHPGEEEFLDEHNGRFCVTPEYPQGIYCYFATVDENWNSAYPYVVGPTFYGNSQVTVVGSIAETVETYSPTSSIDQGKLNEINMFPVPALDVMVVQSSGVNYEPIHIEIFDLSGKLIVKNKINQGSTICYLDVSHLYAGSYVIKFSNTLFSRTKPINIQ